MLLRVQGMVRHATSHAVGILQNTPQTFKKLIKTEILTISVNTISRSIINGYHLRLL